ncbi:UDP-3-O-(3-hydroxymyristoyl)glucosamine N-acyltransferase [Desulfocurvibacter africanus]|uniref:UDP-3-O-acylglucosamine N-acyltransferase n=1 Tax=Desulfocurvibacter africanus subsp. africanus str. Walvis Bay TaxID=690850 RepID=F3Z0Z6_DESAF|nr:UDP-3-O-(3-hydroxymyristoyl)glucosamine N-acyltransferase [Desulfocurvibacter africanus]EGJ51074.1 UDP-3-O-(3-hydroxymyristoyl) glucosamine N-acyltransferase [Desulfocurvibacter africanus subsp. africanus str. Walvis Bay]
MKVKLSQMAEQFGLRLKGADREISGINTLEAAGSTELSFLASNKYLDALENTKAAAVILEEAHADRVQSALISTNPYLSVAQVAKLFDKPQGEFLGHSELAFVHPQSEVDATATIYPFAYVARGAKIGPESKVYPFCYVGEDVTLGKCVTLYPGVTLMARTQVGDGCLIHPGAVLGSDGFGFLPGPTGLMKVPQIGTVSIGNDVEIGCNTAIDRGSLGQTSVGHGTKIDNLVQIAHNVRIGEHSILVGQVGISGSTKIGSCVQIGGQAGLAGHLTVGDGARIGAQSGVMQNIEAGSEVLGSPAVEAKKFFRIAVQQTKLSDMSKRLKALESEIEQLRRMLEQGASHGE